MRFLLRKIKKFFTRQAPLIKDVNYSWASSLSYNFKPQTIVYHHTADNNLTPEKIHELHKQRGWAGIGYHFYIRKDGTIYRGRPENAVGSHAPTVNSTAFGIAVEGNLNNEFLTPEQLESVLALSKYLINKYNISDLKRHKDVRVTECPGKNFPFDDIKTKLGFK